MVSGKIVSMKELKRLLNQVKLYDLTPREKSLLLYVELELQVIPKRKINYIGTLDQCKFLLRYIIKKHSE